ncbi:hypothetical protein [Sphingobacterium bovistauri]|uniref:Tetratricopeptide repeat-containing protein n=1 Tax=Sphingobacterium bovistauri TaxID=2781959 RepID=A0ABS7Z5Z6_9SPHI|nr:hypothetical protein [Sphingobacterium bovistauri]MCA5004977.1 hypothetical protein [Sphingobacterium bovistauri]
MKYNTMFNVDALLSKAESSLFRDEIALSEFSLFGAPNEIYKIELASAISKLQRLLVEEKSEAVREELYYRIGKAYYLMSDFYTALAYFELITNHSLFKDRDLWKINALREIGKLEESLIEINEIDFNGLSPKEASLYYALKSDIFRQQEIKDSAAYYLGRSFEIGVPLKYKFYWQLCLGKMLSTIDVPQAKKVLRKIARSNSAPSLLTLKAEVELINIGSQSVDERITALRELLNRGYSIGLEWLVYAAQSDLYRLQNEVDSANVVSEKVLAHNTVPIAVKNLERWKQGQFMLLLNKLDDAVISFSQIDVEELSLLDKRSKTLILQRENWIVLLKLIDQQQSENTKSELYFSAMYELATFYRENKLYNDAKSILNDLVLINPSKQIDYLHDLYLFDKAGVEDENNVYQQKLVIKQKLYTKQEELYKLLDAEKYEELIVLADAIIDESILAIGDESRVAYIKAMAIGYSQSVSSFVSTLESIKEKYKGYPISELVHKYLEYIDKNKSKFALRKYALEKTKEYFSNRNIKQGDTPIESIKNDSQISNVGTFIDIQSRHGEAYYFVLLLEDMRINLTPVRYAIGQFIRTKHTNMGLGHDLLEFGSSCQLLRVGIFESLDAVTNFEHQVEKMLPEIIKFREKKYSTFVIQKSILDSVENISDIDYFVRKYINK